MRATRPKRQSALPCNLQSHLQWRRGFDHSPVRRSSTSERTRQNWARRVSRPYRPARWTASYSHNALDPCLVALSTFELPKGTKPRRRGCRGHQSHAQPRPRRQRIPVRHDRITPAGSACGSTARYTTSDSAEPRRNPRHSPHRPPQHTRHPRRQRRTHPSTHHRP
jgi:hypothetical protein